MIISDFPSAHSIRVPEFTYTGYYTVKKDEKGWKVKFLSSGKLIPIEDIVVDIFAVGGGGGARGRTYGYSGGGGGGGKTKTVKNITLTAGTEYTITIGAGGAVANPGGTSSFGSIVSADGGTKSSAPHIGGSGGSGAAGAATSGAGFKGGSDGSDGNAVSASYVGKGQGTTTREFGEETGELYAGGGGSGAYDLSKSGGAGGEGGGGRGQGVEGAGEPGADNTGGGGGGGGGIAQGDSDSGSPAAGGSGIVIIRNAR